MFAYGIFKVIYAPRKAFKEIIQNPKYIGPILVMILFVAAHTVFVYTFMSKQYVEQILPSAEQLDQWTENSTLWTPASGVTARDNYDDFINGTYYGNKSIEFSVFDSRQIWMQLNDIGPVNCSGPDGYKNLYLRIKWSSPEDKPENATVYLFSATPSDYFYHNLTEKFSNSTVNVWNNFTIQLETEYWLSMSATANWGNITGLGLEFTWPESSNITLLIDGLFFGGVFKSTMENLSSDMFSFSFYAFMQFMIRWVFLGGLIYIMARAFGAKPLWRPVVILVGFALITMFIQAVINAITFSTLPTLYYRFELIGGVRGESEAAFDKILNEVWLVNQIYGYVQIAVLIWIMALCTIGIRLWAGFSWTKSFFIASVASYVIIMLAERIMLGI